MSNSFSESCETFELNERHFVITALQKLLLHHLMVVSDPPFRHWRHQGTTRVSRHRGNGQQWALNCAQFPLPRRKALPSVHYPPKGLGFLQVSFSPLLFNVERVDTSQNTCHVNLPRFSTSDVATTSTLVSMFFRTGADIRFTVSMVVMATGTPTKFEPSQPWSPQCVVCMSLVCRKVVLYLDVLVEKYFCWR